MPEATWVNLPFAEAIAFFKQKLPLPTSSYTEIIDEAQDWAFTVAGIAKADLLNDVYGAIVKALEDGTTLEEFTQDFDIAAAKAGWQPPPGSEGKWGGWRMELIYMQNLRGAYAAGRFKQMRDPEVATARPYWLWRHRDSRVPRAVHLALDGKVFRGDSVFWDAGGYPPCGYGCKCGVFALSQRDLERRGRKVEDAPTETLTIEDKLTGERQQIPALNGQPIVDPGFVHAAGTSKPEQRQSVLNRSLARLPEPLRRQAREAIQQRSTADFAAPQKRAPNCKKGWSCGSSCISRTRKCRSSLPGQARTYADWLASQSAPPTGGSIFGKLPIAINEVEDATVPQQRSDISCGVACGQMLLRGIGVEASHDDIAAAAGSEFLTPGEVKLALSKLSSESWQENWEFPNSKNLLKLTTPGNAVAIQFERPQSSLRHWVVVDGYDGKNIRIRDPWGLSSDHRSTGKGTRYSVAPQDFFAYWNGRFVRLDHGSSS
ncbi:MAG: hypothetical protein HC781_06435 [Leptolyngbyaceae cyanobacterium CSU_1_4]|nr:hypothetical protein [Leptolyngbyaceae cyanobacterium CSU_1_4]